jgi:hypothetical protein
MTVDNKGGIQDMTLLLLLLPLLPRREGISRRPRNLHVVHLIDANASFPECIFQIFHKLHGFIKIVPAHKADRICYGLAMIHCLFDLLIHCVGY